MPLLPGIFRRELEDRRFLVNHHPLVMGNDVVLDRVTRSPLPPTFRILPGTVVVKQEAARTYVDAEDPRGERCQPATVWALQPADATWAGALVTVSLGGPGLTVPLAPTATTNAAVIGQLNADPALAAQVLADEDQGVVRLRTRAAGAHARVRVDASLSAAFGPQGVEAVGRDADYRVTAGLAELRDLVGTPLDALVPTLLVGHFDARELLHLTPEAEQVLAGRGSFFRR